MEKTINCAECEVKYTYTPNPNYPDKRKYCANCSEKKKAEWAQTTNGDAKPEIVKFNIDSTEVIPIKIGKPKDSGVHLTPERCRSNALAIAHKVAQTNDINEILIIAKHFEKYIVTGE